jgi:hypothetical protein
MPRPARTLSWVVRALVLAALFVTDRILHLWPSRGATVAYLVVFGLLIVQAWSTVANRAPKRD